MIYPDFNRYILIEFLKILTNSYTLSKIVKNQKNQKFSTITITSLKKNQNANIIKIIKTYIIKKN